MGLQVLSDPEKRKVYDQFGEDGLKGGIPPGAANGGGMPGGFPAGGFSFRPGNAEDIFAQVRKYLQSQQTFDGTLCGIQRRACCFDLETPLGLASSLTHRRLVHGVSSSCIVRLRMQHFDQGPASREPLKCEC